MKPEYYKDEAKSTEYVYTYIYIFIIYIHKTNCNVFGTANSN